MGCSGRCPRLAGVETELSRGSAREAPDKAALFLVHVLVQSAAYFLEYLGLGSLIISMKFELDRAKQQRNILSHGYRSYALAAGKPNNFVVAPNTAIIGRLIMFILGIGTIAAVIAFTIYGISKLF